MKRLSGKAIDSIVKNKKTASAKLGPNMVHEILDSLEADH